MASTEHRVGARGAFQADLMLILDPATVKRISLTRCFRPGKRHMEKPWWMDSTRTTSL
jgi:hypothetical protein